MDIRRLQRHEVDLYRTIRLRMLADSPDAFGESLADAESAPPDFWVENVERFTTSPDQVAFIACAGAAVAGSVTSRLMRPPVLTAEQVAILSRALAGALPAPAEAALLGPRLSEAAAALAARRERDPRQDFDLLSHAGLGFADVVRIVPPPPPPGGHRGIIGRMPIGVPGGKPPEGGPPHAFMFPSCVTAMVGGMWVAPAFRRRGVGRALLDAVIVWAESQGAERLELGVTEGNVPAISLYEQAGFVISDRRMPVPPGHTLRFLFMERELRTHAG